MSADQHILVNPPKRIANGLEPPVEDQVEPLLAVTPDNNNARIRVNPHGDCAVRPDVNANVDTGAQPLPEPAAVDAATEAATVCAPPRAADRLPDMVQGCSFRLHYYGSLEINEVHTPSTDAAATAAPSAGRFRSKKHMVEEAVGKLKVGPLTLHKVANKKRPLTRSAPTSILVVPAFSFCFYPLRWTESGLWRTQRTFPLESVCQQKERADHVSRLKLRTKKNVRVSFICCFFFHRQVVSQGKNDFQSRGNICRRVAVGPRANGVFLENFPKFPFQQLIIVIIDWKSAIGIRMARMSFSFSAAKQPLT